MRINEVKPRILKPGNAPVIIDQLKKKVVQMSRKHGIALGNIESWQDNGLYYLNVENNAGSGHFVEEVVSSDRNVEIVQVIHNDGHFDWASDTYIKDSTTVEFKVLNR